MTTQAKHTPGPWEISDGGRNSGPYYFKPSTAGAFFGFYEVAPKDDVIWTARVSRIADARLIAAAPEMAEELLACLDMLEATNGSGPVPIPPRWAKLGPKGTFSHIRAVLQKAGVLDGED